MDDEKQIEEMAKAIVDREKYNVCGYTTCKMCDIGKCDLHCSKYSDISYDCEALYEAGYRKQSDTVREFVEKVQNIKLSIFSSYSEYEFLRAVLNAVSIKIDEIAEEYGVKREEL